MSEITFEQYKQLVEAQSRALLDVVQSVALGDLNASVEIPEGIEVLSELAVGMEMMIGDLREMMAEQERVRAEIERSHQQLEAALEELMSMQQRYLRQEWEGYVRTGQGYVCSYDREALTDDAWLPVMTAAVERQETAVQDGFPAGAELAIPLQLYGEVIGALGFRREGAESWGEDEIVAVEAIAEQIALALESQRLFDQEQYARSLSDMRVNELDCLNDIGREIDQSPAVSELLPWVADRIPTAMRYPELCVVAVEFEGRIYGSGEALDLPRQMVQGLQIGEERVGRICIAYREEREFLDEESALLGDISRRVSGYIENRRLFEQAQIRAEEQTILYRITETVSRSLAMQDLLDETLQTMLMTLRFDAGLVSLSDEKTGRLYLAAQQGLPEPLARTFEEKGLGDTLCELVFETGETLYIEDVRQGAPVNVEGLIKHGLRSYTGTPLSYLETKLGTFCFFNRKVRQVTDRELALLEAIGNQVGVGFQNVRLFAEAQMRAEEQAILNQVAQTITVCQDVDSVLEAAYEGARQLLDAANFYVTLYDAERDQSTLVLSAIDGHIEGHADSQIMQRGGLTDYLTSNRRPLLLPDRVLERVQELGLSATQLQAGRDSVSWLGVPIMIGDQVLGAMVVLSYTTPNAYDERSQDLLAALANQTALGLQSVYSLQETRAALAEVEAAHRSYLRQGWQEHLRQQEMMQRSAFLYDRTQAQRPEDVLPTPDLWRPEMESALTGEGSDAVDGDPTRPAGGGGDGQGARSGARSGAQSGLAVPISLRGQTFGVLGVEAPGGDRQWTEEDMVLMAAVSDQLAQTLESARLFADAQRRAERERLVGEITAKIRASTEIQGILQTTAVELANALGTSRAVVRLGSEEDGQPSASDSPSDRSSLEGGQPSAQAGE